MDSQSSILAGAWTWQRKPISAYWGAATAPDFASRREASTSLALEPIEETMPIPVTTTRRMLRSRWRLSLGPLVEPDPEVGRLIDGVAIGFQHPVADTHD